MAGPVGTLIGAGIGAAAGLIITGVTGLIAAATNEEATSQERTAIEALTEAYEEMGNAALTPENIAKALRMKGITDPELIASLSENKEKLQELIEAEIANTDAIKAENVNLAR
jgi:ferritin-like protein